ncbi:MAG: O-methyltransferase [Bacteroidales bacterium]|nr:O-methyltransferase [Bacteroidales bacterium]MCF8389365.1 O-methyltransferase [Bacteroidales bacterium]
MDLFDFKPEFQQYLEDHTTPEDDILSELRRFTFLKVTHPRMISGAIQGKFLEIFSKMLQPEKILEIGTFTAYSAICLARGLKSGGKLISIEINDELIDNAKVFIRKARLQNSIEVIHGDALELLPQINEEFDIIFIDGEKEQYTDYYKLCLPRLKKGGILIADNVLWDGKVYNINFKNDHTTQAINSFNKFVQNDTEVENLILPLRDGLMVVRKL